MKTPKKTSSTSSSADDPVTQYAQEVNSRERIAGPDIRNACARHLKDLKQGKKRGLVWDLDESNKAIRYYRTVLKLNGGEYEGKPFELLPWQRFIVGSLFGWKAQDGYRRFRVAYVETGKGSGKSPLAAGVALKGLLADGESRAEIYAAATKKDQAMILFRDAVAMVQQSPELSKRLITSGTGQNIWNLAYLKTGSFFRPITLRVITLDLAAHIQPEDRLLINLPSGKTEGRIVKSVSGHSVTVLADYSELPQPESSWSVESADFAVMRFRVQTIEPNGLHQFEIKAVQHEPGKYNAIDNGARIDPQPITIMPPGVMNSPQNIHIQARSSITQGLAVSTMRISWDASKGAVAYNVEWRKNNSSWIRLPSNGTLGAEVEGIYSGRYIARVSAVNAMGVASVWGNSLEVVLEGKVGLPPAVTHLTTHSRFFEIGLKWGFPPGAEDTQRTELWYSPVNVLDNAVKLSDLAFPQADYSLQSLAAGAQFFFWARLVDRTGNTGPFYPVKDGVIGQASAEAGPILELIAGQIGETELGKHLLDKIELIDGDGPGSVNGRLNDAKKELQDLIGDITDALEYDNTHAYATGDMVRLGSRLFQAIIVTTGHPPPDATYWIDLGTLAETTNALVLQVQKNSASIIEQDGKITAQAEQLNAINAKVIDPLTGLEATASGLSSLSTTVETLDGKVTATAEKVDGVYAFIDSGSAGDENGSAGDETSSAGAWSIMSAIAERDFAQSVRTDTVEAQVGQNAASIIDVATATADANSALASKISQVSAQVGETNAAVQVVSRAHANLEGKADAMWSVKMQVNANGQLVTAGIGLGIETDANGVTQSQFLVSADRFAVVGALAGGEVFTPFVIQGGQVFMQSAFIQNGSISMLKIGEALQSDNYVAGVSGWRLSKAGNFEINGYVPGQGKMQMTNRSLRVYDANNIKRLQLGDLSE